MMQSKEDSVPVPGIWATIAAGFDVTAKHFWVVFIPVLLDSFLWLGPRLSFRLLLERVIAFLQQQGMAVMGMNLETLAEIAPRTNLFTSLSVPLMGVPVLMVGMTPEKTPLSVTVTEVGSVWLWFLLFVLFNVIGLLLTAVYFTQTAYAIRQQDDGKISLGAFLQRAGKVWLQLLGLVISFFVVVMVVYVPLAIISVVVALISQGLASIILLIGPVILIWLLIYLSFTPHGLVMNDRSLWRSMIESLHLIRHYMLPALLFLLWIMIIGQAMDWVLLLADDGSWLTWISIWGHAFVSTALVAATFIFYRERYTQLFGEGGSTVQRISQSVES